MGKEQSLRDPGCQDDVILSIMMSHSNILKTFLLKNLEHLLSAKHSAMNV